MGSGLQRMMDPKPLEEGIGEIAPFLRSPLTDIAAPLLHCDHGDPCSSFEANYLDCQEAYGHIKAKSACKDYYHDLSECMFAVKQAKRIVAMMDERWKQYVKGELGLGPKVQRYAEPPKMNSYGPAILDNEI